METLNVSRTPAEIFNEAQAAITRPVNAFVPANADEQQHLFLEGTIDVPDHHYDKLDAIDFESVDTRLGELANEIAQHSEVPERYKPIYEAYFEETRLKNRFMQLSHALKQESVDDAQKQDLEAEHQAINERLYGKPDRDTFKQLLAQKFQSLPVPDSQDEAAMRIYNELKELIPQDIQTLEATELYAPADETVAAMQRVVNVLYGKLLAHVPDREGEYSMDEVETTFREIVETEFGEAAGDWKVVRIKRSGIHVDASKQRIQIPEKGKSKTPERLRDLVVHELGVHFLHSIMGDETDLHLMRVGLPEYFDAEEGLGVLMEHARKGEFKPGGVYHYIVAGLIESGQSFRGAHDIRWRLEVLSDYEAGKDLNEEAIAKAKDTAYKGVVRITRAGDRPWYKDLSYYNGEIKNWQYFDRHAGDDLMLSLAMIGKLDPSNTDHIRTALETRTL
ncbi:MAG: hypothetical protein JWP13_406 [Candidatus Saccharibacteria bacterium]|nr:hypothetical protein [Candidatus Saccharibacteria bacterium]